MDPSKIDTFMAMTGAEKAIASSLLEASNWDLQNAVNLFFETGGGGGGLQSSASSSSNNNSALAGSPLVRAPIPAKRQRLYDNIGPVVRNMGSNRRPSRDAFRDFAAESRDMQGMSNDKNKRLGDLFRPPRETNFKGNFDQARAAGRQEGRWILVNIQDNEEFLSYALNRDVFSHEIIKPMLQKEFVLFQKYPSDPDGQLYITFYKPQRPFPHIGIIDPYTGEKMLDLKLSGFDEALRMKFLEQITKFLDQNKLNGAGLHTAQAPLASSRPPPRAPSSSASSLINASEDEQLAAAIAASLKESEVVQIDDDDDDDGVQAIDVIESDNDNNDNDSNNGDATDSPMDLVETGEASVVEKNTLPPLEDEPAKDDPERIRIRVRLADRKTLMRSFKNSQMVAQLFSFVHSQCDDPKDFDLIIYPNISLKGMMDKTMEEAKLANQSVSQKWL